MVQLRELPFLAILLVVFAVVLTIGAVINQDIRDDQTAGSYAYNVSEEGLQGLENMGERQDTLGTVLIAGAIIAVIMSVFAFRRGY